MALTVEDGSGLSAAESYETLAAFKAYCSDRGYDLGSLTDPVLEGKLRVASQYIDASYRFKGTRLVAAQGLEFPRSGATDHSGFDVTGVPKRVKQACCELAFQATSTSLTDVVDKGNVLSESVAGISVTYDKAESKFKVFQFAEGLLKPYLLSEARFMYLAPQFVNADNYSNPAVQFGSMDNPPFSSDLTS
jgi:hypothetical protein